MITSPDSIVFGPDRPSDTRDKAIESIMSVDEIYAWLERSMNELVSAVEAPVGSYWEHGELVHPTMR